MSSGLPPISSLKPLGVQFARSKKQQTSPLVNMPTEILLQILSYTNLQDTISLSTSCKYLLRILFFISFPGGLLFQKLPDLAHIKLILFLSRLAWPREVDGRAKRDLRYCNACRRIYPEKRQNWKEKLSIKIGRDFWNNLKSPWEMCLHCPKCVLNHKRMSSWPCYDEFVMRWEQICAEHIGWFGN